MFSRRLRFTGGDLDRLLKRSRTFWTKETASLSKSVPICRCPICPNLSLSHLCWTNLSLPNLMLPNLSLPNVSLPNLMLDQGDCVVVQICPNLSLSNCCPTRLEMTKLFYASESKTNQPLKRVSSVIEKFRSLVLKCYSHIIRIKFMIRRMGITKMENKCLLARPITTGTTHGDSNINCRATP